MQALTQAEMNEVRGGMELVDAAAMITSLIALTRDHGVWSSYCGRMITLDLMSEN